MIQTQDCLVSQSVQAGSSLCALALQDGCGLTQSDHSVAFPGFSMHFTACGMWKHFVKCEGPRRHGRAAWHFQPLHGCGGGRGCLACLCSNPCERGRLQIAWPVTQPFLWAAFPTTTKLLCTGLVALSSTSMGSPWRGREFCYRRAYWLSKPQCWSLETLFDSYFLFSL